MFLINHTGVITSLDLFVLLKVSISKTFKRLLNIENTTELFGYLRKTKRVWSKQISKTDILRGGVSNRTVLLEFVNGEAWVLKQALEKLRVKGKWTSNPSRIFREAEAMRWFEKYAPLGTVPKLVFEDQNRFLLAMEAVQPPFDNLKTLLLNAPPESSYFVQSGELLGHIHQQSQEHFYHLPPVFQDGHFFQALRIGPYYLESAKALPETAVFFQKLIAETLEDEFTLVHGDYSPKNLLVKDDGLILLDHEVIHYGDGTFDLGFFICHLLSKANHLPQYKKEFLNGVVDFYDSYCKVFKGINKIREKRAVRHAIGCLLARICGLSPLEYLTEKAQQRQKLAGIMLAKDPPPTIRKLVLRFNDLVYG